MWAWGTKTRLDDADGTAVLVESARKAGLNELYLSVNDGVLEDPRLPRLMETLGHAGLRVEALMGEATWYEPGQRSAMLAHIDEVAAFTNCRKIRAIMRSCRFSPTRSAKPPRTLVTSA